MTLESLAMVVAMTPSHRRLDEPRVYAELKVRKARQVNQRAGASPDLERWRRLLQSRGCLRLARAAAPPTAQASTIRSFGSRTALAEISTGVTIVANCRTRLTNRSALT